MAIENPNAIHACIEYDGTNNVILKNSGFTSVTKSGVGIYFFSLDQETDGVPFASAQGWNGLGLLANVALSGNQVVVAVTDQLGVLVDDRVNVWLLSLPEVG